MDTFSRDELRTLLNESTALSISIYMPTHRSVAESRQDQITLKTLLREAQEQLLARGLHETAVTQFLAPARELEGNSAFWRERSDGLAIFLTETTAHQYHVPLNLPRLVFAGHRFYVKPLLPLLDSDYEFFILAFSQNALRLLRATRYHAIEMDTGDCPRSLDDALRGEESAKQLQYHTFASGGGQHVTFYHGQGARVDTKKDKIRRYLRRVDLALRSLLRNAKAPLVLAADDNLFPLYREVNTYPNLMAEGIAGNPEGMSLEDLHKSAIKIVEPEFRQEREEAVAHFKRLAGTALASSDLPRIVRAAYQGRVAVLFVPNGQEQWGTFDPDADTVTLHQEREAGDDGLIDLAAFYTLKFSGMTYAAESPLAAIFRC
jgi:hypothetical protein